MDRLKSIAKEVLEEGEDAGGKGFSILVSLEPERVQDFAKTAFSEGFFLEFITAEDWKDYLSVIYSFRKKLSKERIIAKVDIKPGEKLLSLARIFPSADPFEREVFDMFGISFEGHPRMRRILTSEEIEGYPLRKDWDPEENYKKMEEKLLKSLGLSDGG